MTEVEMGEKRKLEERNWMMNSGRRR